MRVSSICIRDLINGNPRSIIRGMKSLFPLAFLEPPANSECAPCAAPRSVRIASTMKVARSIVVCLMLRRTLWSGGVRIVRRLVLLGVVLMLATSCALSKNEKGGTVILVGLPEVLSREVSTFRLADGGEGVLREYGGNYSIMLRDYREVIRLGDASSARIVRVDTIEGQTVVVVEKATKACPRRYTVIGIRSREVKSWDIPECLLEPTFRATEAASYIEYWNASPPRGYAYRNDQLFKLRPGTQARTSAAAPPLPSNSPGERSSKTPSGESAPPSRDKGSALALTERMLTMPRYVPKAPARTSVSIDDAPLARSPSLPPPQAAPQGSAGPRSTPAPRQHAPALVFTDERLEPVRIVLTDK